LLNKEGGIHKQLIRITSNDQNLGNLIKTNEHNFNFL
jgi:hypothetical protein